MAHAEGRITINRRANEVFDFILDGTHNQLWRPGVLDIQRVSILPDGVGAKFKQGVKGPGGRIDADYEIVECVPNQRIKFQVTAGPARPTGSYDFQPHDSATTVTFILDFQPKGLSKLMDPLIGRQMKVEVGTLSDLKTYLERR